MSGAAGKLSIKAGKHAALAGLIVLLVGYALSVQAASNAEPAAATVKVSEKFGISPAYSPPLRQPFDRNLYWGDLHLHSRLSMDAYIEGTRNLGQDDAYRFAMGETVIADNGVPARLSRPLDFLAVTDHSENMGLYVELANGNPQLTGSVVEKSWGGVLDLIGDLGLREAFLKIIGEYGPMPDLPDELQATIWENVARTADRFNRPGQFTTIIGYEWTAMITGDNLHRVVLYRDDADRVAKTIPANAQRNSDPENLWDALERYEDNGGQVLAIAHNGNLSNGRMFAPNRVNGKPLDKEYAQKRARWEPVYEVTQIKGDGEAHPNLSPTDEFAAFEKWDTTNVASNSPKEDWMLRYEYARSALLLGLQHEQTIGINPFKFGMVGGTDSHTGLSTTEEDNFFGKFRSSNPSPLRSNAPSHSTSGGNWEFGASGLTAVWAEENTRASIFDAIKRREVYATTGSRIGLRFFGGWHFSPSDITRHDYARNAYANGVAMGSDLPAENRSTAPGFLIHAMRDPYGANLDRIQVVKGWIDQNGIAQEKIYNVALSDDRKVDRNNKVKPLRSTVDLENARYSNSIGDAELATYWRDPDFNPALAAFYYVRVLEIPTPRWTTYDRAFYRTTLSKDTPLTVQDRAYSSPIWYRP